MENLTGSSTHLNLATYHVIRNVKQEAYHVVVTNGIGVDGYKGQYRQGGSFLCCMTQRNSLYKLTQCTYWCKVQP